MIHFLVPRAQVFGILGIAHLWGPDFAERFSLIHYEELPALASLPTGTYVFTALDQLSPPGLRLARELEVQLRSAGPAVRVLNSPRGTLLRFGLLEALWQHGLNRHRVVRATGDLSGLRFPVFLREEHQHTGSLSPLLRTAAEVQSALARAIVRGYRLNQLLIVEFCDTADATGCYRKFAAMVIGSEIVPQYLSSGHKWNLKQGSTEFTAEMVLEERSYQMENPHERELRRIFALAEVQYGRIDYSLKDGVLETWEINLNPTLGGLPELPPELHQLSEPGNAFYFQRFREAFEAVDLPSAAAPLAIRYSTEGLPGRDGMLRRRHNSGVPGGLVRALGPIRPAVEGMLRLVSPLLVRAARLFERR